MGRPKPNLMGGAGRRARAGWEAHPTVQALVYTDWDQLEVGEVPEPSCRPEEAVIRVAACGICGSELGSFVPEPPGGGLARDGHEFRHDDTIVEGCPARGRGL
jgi:hypothetical protein